MREARPARPRVRRANVDDRAGRARRDVTAPELNAETKELTAWDEPVGASGKAAPKVLPEDEASIAERLVYEGTDEAERERRIAAADPDFEP